MKTEICYHDRVEITEGYYKGQMGTVLDQLDDLIGLLVAGSTVKLDSGKEVPVMWSAMKKL